MSETRREKMRETIPKTMPGHRTRTKRRHQTGTRWIALAKVTLIIGFSCFLACRPTLKTSIVPLPKIPELVAIQPGEFEMGSRELGLIKPASLTDLYWIGKYEVSQSQWKHVMKGDTPPWHGKLNAKEGDHFPATYVSWHDAVRFCEELTRLEHEAGRLTPGYEYRLPTEAEWEYACRAGTTTTFSFGDGDDELTDYAWYTANTLEEPFAHAVGGKRPNPWGLYDMHGNVCEWCADSFDLFFYGGSNPFIHTFEHDNVVTRGGAWDHESKYCHSAARLLVSKSHQGSNVGFRVCLGKPLAPSATYTRPQISSE